MTPQTVNAYYEPTANEIVFPAAILQAPYFNLGFDAAANYGGIGGVIGHEMTHGFRRRGARLRRDRGAGQLVGGRGRPKFDARAAALAAQYDTYEPIRART